MTLHTLNLERPSSAFVLSLFTPCLLAVSCLAAQTAPVKEQTAGTPTLTVTVACGGDLQGAINRATAGTTIKVAHLSANGRSRCQWASYSLPWRPDAGTVTIATDGAVPASGTRTAPGDSYLALFVAQPVSGWYTVFSTASNGPNQPVHGYAFSGLEITAPNDTLHASYGLVMLGGYNNTGYTLADIPHDFSFMHCYIHGANANQEIGRGISADASNLTVRDSVISEIHSTFIESNTILGVTTAGNWVIENNDLQSACENLMWGGAPTLVANLVPSGMTFRFNYVHKPLAWRNYLVHGTSAYITKNLLEFKEGTNLLIDSNVFEYSWNQTQGGWGVLFTPRMYQSLQLDTTVQNVTFTNNTLRHMVNGISLALYDDLAVSTGMATLQQALAAATKQFLIQNNLFDDLDGGAWGGNASFGIALSTVPSGAYTHGFTLDHNTFNYGPTVKPNSYGVLHSIGATCNTPVAGTDYVMTYNMFGQDMGRDCAVGPTAVPFHTVYTHNDITSTWVSPATWAAAFPTSSIFVNSTSNPDSRGANLSQLGSLETLVKSGKICAANVSAQVSVTRGVWHYNRAANTYSETLTLTNTGTSSLTDINVAFSNVTPNTQILSSTESTQCGSTPGLPLQTLASTLPPGQSATLNVVASANSAAAISFTTSVTAGLGMK